MADVEALAFTKDLPILFNMVHGLTDLSASFEFLAPSSGQSVLQLQFAFMKVGHRMTFMKAGHRMTEYVRQNKIKNIISNSQW